MSRRVTIGTIYLVLFLCKAVAVDDTVYAARDGDAAYSCVINDDQVRLRGGPYLESVIITHLNRGEKAGIIDRTTKKERLENREAYWYRVRLQDGRDGWVFGAYVEGGDERYDLITKDVERFVTQEKGRLVTPGGGSLGVYQMSSLEKMKGLPLEMKWRITDLFLDESIETGELPDISYLPYLGYVSLNGIKSLININGIKNSAIRAIDIRGTSVTDISVLSTCKYLRSINAVGTEITALPDFSRLYITDEEKEKLKPLYTRGEARFRGLVDLCFDDTPLLTLDGVETIPVIFFLSIRGCDKLINLDALLNSNIIYLNLDEKNYQRLKPWFDTNLPTLKAKNKNFRFAFMELE
jgi:hypothetical protein